MKKIMVVFSVDHSDSIEAGLKSNQLSAKAKLRGLADLVDKETQNKVTILDTEKEGRNDIDQTHYLQDLR